MNENMLDSVDDEDPFRNIAVKGEEINVSTGNIPLAKENRA